MLPYKIAFASLKGINVEIAQHILSIIPSEKEFFTISEGDLSDILGIKNKIIEKEYRNKLLQKAEREIEFIDKNNIHVTYYNDADYPIRLNNAPDSPLLFYSKGECDLNATKIVSIVGTRHATQYGLHFCEQFIKDIATNYPNIIIVSGLAYGIDICAHRAALKESLSTVAVLAHGLNTIYPAQHRNNAIDIIRNNGMLLTDYTSQDSIHRANFLARNRIVAALADCTLVIESAIKGGALVTANIAQSYNRDVFALPGRTSDQYSEGCNKLIKQNIATLITNTDDLISAMQWEKPKNNKPKELNLFPDFTDDEQKVVDYITHNGEVHINTLSNNIELPISQLLSILVELEFKGVTLSLPGNKYTIA